MTGSPVGESDTGIVWRCLGRASLECAGSSHTPGGGAGGGRRGGGVPIRVGFTRIRTFIAGRCGTQSGRYMALVFSNGVGDTTSKSSPLRRPSVEVVLLRFGRHPGADGETSNKVTRAPSVAYRPSVSSNGDALCTSPSRPVMSNFRSRIHRSSGGIFSRSPVEDESEKCETKFSFFDPPSFVELSEARSSRCGGRTSQ